MAELGPTRVFGDLKVQGEIRKDGKRVYVEGDIPNASTSVSGLTQLSSSISSTSTTLAATPSAVKIAYDLANEKASPDDAMRRPLRVSKSGKDANGVFTTVEYRRKSDNTLYARSTLSGGTSPSYTTRTVTQYATNGSTIIQTDVYTLTYDTDGELISEV